MYNKFNEKLPKYWVVRCTEDNLKEFRETVITYIRSVYSVRYIGGSDIYYGYDGNDGNNGIDWYTNSHFFINNPTILTLEEFKSYFEEFELPEIWWVRVTDENRDILSKWRQVNKLYLTDKIVGMTRWKDGRLEKGHKTLNHIKCDNYDFGEEITFEQFKKYVLKQEIVMKEIIGYKLKKDCEQYLEAAQKIANKDCKFNSGNKLEVFLEKSQWGKFKSNLEEAGVLDLWFEPVYKEEGFKVGDWVTFYSEIYGCNYTDRIKEWTSHSYCKLERGLEPFKHLLRKATPEEIAKAQSKEVYFGKVKFTIKPGQDYAETEYGKVPKKDIQDAIDWVKNAPSLAGYQFSIHNIELGEHKTLIDISTGCIDDTKIGFGCKYGTLGELEAIFKAFD